MDDEKTTLEDEEMTSTGHSELAPVPDDADGDDTDADADGTDAS